MTQNRWHRADMGVCACQEMKVVFLCQLRLAHTHAVPGSKRSVYGPSVSCRSWGSPFSALSLVYHLYFFIPPVCKAPFQTREQERCKIWPYLSDACSINMKNSGSVVRGMEGSRPWSHWRRYLLGRSSMLLVFEPTCVRSCAWCQFSGEQGDAYQGL